MGFPRALRSARRSDARRRAAAQQPLRTGGAVWRRLPAAMRRRIRELELQVWVINAYRVAREAGMGQRINTVMQACFFAVSGVLPREEAIERIRDSIRKTYGRKGEAVVAHRTCGPSTPPWPSAAAGWRGCPRRRNCRPQALPERRWSRSRLCAGGDRTDARASGGRTARERPSLRRHLARGHGPLGEAQHRRIGPGVGEPTSACSAASA